MSEKFSPWLDALGTERMEQLEGTRTLVEALQEFAGNAELLLTVPLPLSEQQLISRALYAEEHPEEAWAGIVIAGEWRFCLDHTTEDSADAVTLPPIHMQLLTWWLTHTWRYIELVDGCIASLHSWDLHIATVLARALVEEVACCLYEAQLVEQLWKELKALPPKNRAAKVFLRFIPLLQRFHFGSRGLDDSSDEIAAVNVLTYVDKLDKQCKGDEIRIRYNSLSNAAHPAILARMVYAVQVERRSRDGIYRAHVARRPVPIPEQEPEQFQSIGRLTADSVAAVVTNGLAVIWQALRIVDDFGQTTEAYRLTKRRYWRKFGLQANESRCPCSCGGSDRSDHQWGCAAPEIVFPPTEQVLHQIAEWLA